MSDRARPVDRAEDRAPKGEDGGRRTRPGAAPVRAGMLGGVLASLPVLGPLLGTLCLSCASIGGAAAGGAVLGLKGPYFLAAGGAVLALAWWRSVKRARRACGPGECRGQGVRLALLLGTTAVATYLLVTFVLVPGLARALEELGRGLSHQPTVQGGTP